MSQPTAQPHRHRVRRIIGKILGVLVVLIVLLFAYIGVLTLLRDTPSTTVIAVGDSKGPPSPADPAFASTMSYETITSLVPGNTIDLLVSGVGTYPVLWQTMRSAKKS